MALGWCVCPWQQGHVRSPRTNCNLLQLFYFWLHIVLNVTAHTAGGWNSVQAMLSTVTLGGNPGKWFVFYHLQWNFHHLLLIFIRVFHIRWYCKRTGKTSTAAFQPAELCHVGYHCLRVLFVLLLQVWPLLRDAAAVAEHHHDRHHAHHAEPVHQRPHGHRTQHQEALLHRLEILRRASLLCR